LIPASSAMSRVRVAAKPFCVKSLLAASLIFSSVVAFWLGSAFEGRLALEVFVFLVVLVGVLAIARVMSVYRAKVGWGF